MEMELNEETTTISISSDQQLCLQFTNDLACPANLPVDKVTYSRSIDIIILILQPEPQSWQRNVSKHVGKQ